VPGAPDGLGWRTRVGFAVDADGTVGLHRHRSHELVPVERCPIATDGVNDARVPSVSWKGARQLEVLASPDGGSPVVLVDTGKRRIDGLPALDFPVPGPLPPPGTGSTAEADPSGQGQAAVSVAPLVRGARTRTIPDLPTDCGGPCVVGGAPTLPTPAPAPTTTAPTTTLAPTTTTTTKKGPGP